MKENTITCSKKQFFWFLVEFPLAILSAIFVLRVPFDYPQSSLAQESMVKENNQQISVLTYNVLNGAYVDKLLSGLSEKISRPDLICSQEFPINKDLRLRFENYFKSGYSSQTSSKLNSPNSGIGVTTFWNNQKLILKKSKIISLPQAKLTWWAKIFLYSLKYGQTGPFDRRALLTTFEVQGLKPKNLMVVNLHLAWEGGEKHLIKQLEKILEETTNEKDSAIILCGDFNMRKNNKTFQRALSLLKEKDFYEATAGVPYSVDLASHYFLPQAKTKPFQIAIRWVVRVLKRLGLNTKQKVDYIFVKDLEKVSTSVYEIEGSDHYPLLARFVLLNFRAFSFLFFPFPPPRGEAQISL